MHEDWWALWAVWPWHARSHIHITPRLRVNSIAPLLKTPLPAEHTHTRTHVCMHARTRTQILSVFLFSHPAQKPGNAGDAFCAFPAARAHSQIQERGDGKRGERAESERRKKKAKRERSTGMCLGCSWTPQKTVIWGGGGAIKGTAFRGLRANIAVPWGLRKEIIQERSEWAETGWKRRTNPGWLGAAGRALFHPDPGETHEDRGEAPGLHVNVSQSTCVSDQRHSYPVLFPR